MLGSADIASSLSTGVRYPIQATHGAQKDSPAKLKTATKSPLVPVPSLGAQEAQGQGGTTPPSERDIIHQKRLQRFASDTSDKSSSNQAQRDVMASIGSVQSPLLSPSVALTDSTADIPTLDSQPSGVGFEIGDMIQVDRPDSAPWYGVIRWMGTLPGGSSLSAGIEMVCYKTVY